MRFRFIGLCVLGIFLVALEIYVGILTTSEFTDQEALFESTNDRPSITFLMGEDKEGQHYFELAEQHFLFDRSARTDRVVKSCRTLTELVEYLNRNAQPQPWGLIQVVVHGNVWSGLSVPMWQDGPRAYPKDLLKAVQEDAFPKLRHTAADRKTKINFWACGIGKNPFLTTALSRMFETDALEMPQVYASPHFVIFRQLPDGVVQRMQASYWPYFFKRGYRPSVNQIAHDYRQTYPDETLDWRVALTNEDLASDSAIFHSSFHIPVVWTRYYADRRERPSVNSSSEKMDWINNQVGLQKKIKALGIPQDQYHWTVNKVLITEPDGSIRPAIKAIGMSTVICVMQAMRADV